VTVAATTPSPIRKLVTKEDKRVLRVWETFTEVLVVTGPAVYQPELLLYSHETVPVIA
jgi:hypothetical protein